MITTLLTLLFACTETSNQTDTPRLVEIARPGDILLQTEYSAQSWAVREATGSSITHVGVIIDIDGDGGLEVLEAAGPVGVVSIEDFATRGPTHIRRLVDHKKHVKNIEENLAPASFKYLDLPYDGKFKWDDEMIYCSELVWKVYSDIGIEISPRQKFSDFKLDGPLTKRLIAARMPPGESIDLNEFVVTPGTIEQSGLLYALK